MHNSGTSLLGGLLYAAGVPMGNRLLMRQGIPKGLRPKYDYYEDQDIVHIQENTLKLIKRHWSSYRSSYPIESVNSTERRDFREELQRILKIRFKNKKLWAVKDPRISVLIEDWLNVLEEGKIKTKLIIVHREPYSNISSFSDKGQVPKLWAEALWQRTYWNVLNLDKCINSEDIMFTNFDKLLNDSENELKSICEFLNHKYPKEMSLRIKNHINRNLPTKIKLKNEAVLHKATDELNQILNSKSWGSKLPKESELLANEIKNAVNIHELELGLNSLHKDHQSILPKSRISIITSELQGFGNSGGIGTAYYELALSLNESGHPITILLANNSIQDGIEIIQSGLKILGVNTNDLSRIEVNREIAKHIKIIKPEIIHVHEWLGLGSNLKDFQEGEKAKIIVGLHGPTAWTRRGNPWPRDINNNLTISENSLYEEGIIRALETDLILNADILISPSIYMNNWVQRNFNLNENKIISQRNCPMDKGKNPLSIPSTSSNEKTLVFFGRLEERKGIILFLDAIEKTNFKAKKIFFLGNDCMIREERMASKIISERLEKLKILYEIKEGLNREQALVLLREINSIVIIPSIIENSPCVVEELLNSNLKVITTKTGGTEELILKSDRKWLSKPNSIALAKKIDQALSTTSDSDFRLHEEILGWKIRLSWQAFHERLPIQREINDIASEKKISLGKKIINKSRHTSKKIYILTKDFIRNNVKGWLLAIGIKR